MALLFACGFDHITDYAGMDDLWGQTPASNVTLQATDGAFGGKCIRVDTNSPAGVNGLHTKTLPAATTQRGSATNPFHLAFWHRAQATPDSFEVFMMLSNSQNPTEGVRFSSQTDGTWDVAEYDNTGGTLRGSTTTDMMDGAYHHVEMVIVISDTVGVFKVWIDGNATPEIDFSGDTFGLGSLFGSLGLDLVYFGGHDPISADIIYADYDDILIWDEEGTGLVTSGQLGQHRIVALPPTGDGNSSQFTPLAGTNWQSVDELSAADGDTTYVETAVLNNQDLYTHGSLGYNPITVHGAALNIRSRYTGAGVPTLNGRVRSGTTEADAEGGVITQTAAYVQDQRWVDTDPDTAAAFTGAALEAAQFGFDAQSVGDTARVSQFFVEAVLSSAGAAVGGMMNTQGRSGRRVY